MDHYKLTQIKTPMNLQHKKEVCREEPSWRPTFKRKKLHNKWKHCRRRTNHLKKKDQIGQIHLWQLTHRLLGHKIRKITITTQHLPCLKRLLQQIQHLSQRMKYRIKIKNQKYPMEKRKKHIRNWSHLLNLIDMFNSFKIHILLVCRV